MKRCPCCNGVGEIEDETPCIMTPLEFRLWDIVRRAKHGISGADVIEKLYADRIDGGPLTAQNVVAQVRLNLNRKLEASGQEIVSSTPGRGAVFTIKYHHRPTKFIPKRSRSPHSASFSKRGARKDFARRVSNWLGRQA